MPRTGILFKVEVRSRAHGISMDFTGSLILNSSSLDSEMMKCQKALRIVGFLPLTQEINVNVINSG